MPERANILLLMTDEHRADVLGYAGNPVAVTPNLDRLAENAVVFDNAYCPSPICVPCRQAMAAGQWPRTCGVERYGQDLPPGSMTFARRFSQFGYDTVCCGKLHHDGYDQMQGWRRRIGSNCRVDHRAIEGFDPASFEGRPPAHDYRLLRKDVWEVRRAGVGRGSATHVPDELALLGARRYVESHFVDPYYDRASPAVPTLLMVSFNRPHYPWLTDEARFMHYLNRVEPYLDQRPSDHPFLSKHRVVVGEDATEREVRRATAAYYGMVEEVDHDFGLVLDALDRAGQDLDDWVVVFTSDHGEMLGQHGVWEKQVFYEGSARVPLFVRWPRRFAPGRVAENVNLIDLFPTLCGLAGVPLPEDADTVNAAGLDGRSLVPLLSGDASGWDNETVSQFDGTNLMIKREALKYQWYGRDDCGGEHREVLFDLASDPGEARNAIADAAHADAVAAFRARRGELGFS